MNLNQKVKVILSKLNKIVSSFFIFQREGAVTKHLSSSTEDLLILFEAEKDIINSLKTNFSTFNHETKDAYLKSVDFDENQDPG